MSSQSRPIRISSTTTSQQQLGPQTPPDGEWYGSSLPEGTQLDPDVYPYGTEGDNTSRQDGAKAEEEDEGVEEEGEEEEGGEEEGGEEEVREEEDEEMDDQEEEGEDAQAGSGAEGEDEVVAVEELQEEVEGVGVEEYTVVESLPVPATFGDTAMRDCDYPDDSTPESSSDSSEEDNRTDSELAAIALEIRDLEAAVPILRRDYHILDRLGEGTFSTVYKAIDVNHTWFDNSRWAPDSPPGSDGDETGQAYSHPLPQELTPPRSSEEAEPGDPFTARSGTRGPTNAFAQMLLRQSSQTKSTSSVPFPTGSTAPELANDKRKAEREEMDLNRLPQARPSRKGNVYVALKRIYVTSSPQRILNELALLADLRNSPNVAYLVQAIRHEDQVIVIMPYTRHQDFRTFYRTASLSLIRAYLRTLFRGLAACHAQGILHRDIKPANFLFDLQTRDGQLCDFGLAERMTPDQWYGRCLHGLPWPNHGNPHGYGLDAPTTTWDQLQDQWASWRAMFPQYADGTVPVPPGSEAEKRKPWAPADDEDFARMQDDAATEEEWQAYWSKAPIGGLFGAGWGKKGLGPHATGQDRIGFRKDDQRPNAKANRAGTRGFRAPEVLFKCPDQTCAVDIWSIGIIMLCFLTRRFPFFNSNDDTEALMEITAIFGRKKMELCAAQHNRTVVTNIPHLTKQRFSSLHSLVRTLNPSLYAEHRPRPTPTSPRREKMYQMAAHRQDALAVEGVTPSGVTTIPNGGEGYIDPYDEEWYEGSELWEAVQLMKSCLHMDCTKRTTAEGALRHPFITMPDSD